MIGKIKAWRRFAEVWDGLLSWPVPPSPCVNRPWGGGFVNTKPLCPPRLMQPVPTG